MALYIRHSIFHLARLLYVRPETFGLYYVPLLDVQYWRLMKTLFVLKAPFEVQLNLRLKFTFEGS